MRSATAQEYADHFAAHIMKEFGAEWLRLHEKHYDISQVLNQIWQQHADTIEKLEQLGIDTEQMRKSMLQSVKAVVDEHHAASEEKVKEKAKEAKRASLGDATKAGIQHASTYLDGNLLHAASTGDVFTILQKVIGSALKASEIMTRYQKQNADALKKAEEVEYAQAGRKINVQIVKMFSDTFKDVLKEAMKEKNGNDGPAWASYVYQPGR